MTVYSVLRSCSPGMLGAAGHHTTHTQAPTHLVGHKTVHPEPAQRPSQCAKPSRVVKLGATNWSWGSGGITPTRQGSAGAAGSSCCSPAVLDAAPVHYGTGHTTLRHAMALHPGASHHVAGVCRVGGAVSEGGLVQPCHRARANFSVEL